MKIKSRQYLQSDKRINHLYDHQIFYNNTSIMSTSKKAKTRLLLEIITVYYINNHNREKDHWRIYDH